MDSPFFCDMSAMNADERANHRALAKALRSEVAEVREIADGYAIRFPTEASTAVQLVEFATLERLCCPFFTLAIEMERNRGPVWLKVTGEEGIKPFIRAEFGF